MEKTQEKKIKNPPPEKHERITLAAAIKRKKKKKIKVFLIPTGWNR
jgi:hypothetical protein